jgi:hydroxymethylpyrimidine/phosphomethylpyrimidine kinase
MMKRALSIAGSDCSGGAGIQADLKTFSAHGVYGMSVIVSVVAENTGRVIGIQDVSPDMIGKQIDAVFEDIGADAVKVGMLSTPECMEEVARKLKYYHPANIVIDPVMYAKNGCPLMEPAAVKTLIRTIIPLAGVLTPNIPEAEKIAGGRIKSVEDMEEAAKAIHAMGCGAVVVKGGHASGNAVDVLFDGKELCHFETARIDTKNTHGTGCTFSSAVASQLAIGMDLRQAVQKAKDYVTMAIVHSLDIGKGHGPTHHFWHLYQYGLREGQYCGEERNGGK